MFRLLYVLVFSAFLLPAKQMPVGNTRQYKSIQLAIDDANKGDTILIDKGTYHMHEYLLKKQLTFIGINYPVITGPKSKIIEVVADSVSFIGITFTDVPTSYINDDAAIRFTKVDGGLVRDCKFRACFFAIHIAHSEHVSIINNNILSTYSDEASSGNAIHGWYSKYLTITDNEVHGHRDGIYLEFVENSTITKNGSHDNLRYGLHFMFSHNNVYTNNTFMRNGAGCAVMYSNNVTMLGNTFKENWGPTSYGLLLKDIKDSKLDGNVFFHNSVAVHMDNAMRITLKNNVFRQNGWGLRIMGNCMDNVINQNDFVDNSFQVATNSQNNYNDFTGNYWSDYTGYDLNRNNIGDVPHRPVSLYTYMVTQNPPTVILMRSVIIDLLNIAEKVMPTITPETLVDTKPLMKPAHVSR